MVWKRQRGSKKRVGGYGCVSERERERLVGIKAPSLTRAPISPVYFLGGVASVRV